MAMPFLRSVVVLAGLTVAVSYAGAFLSDLIAQGAVSPVISGPVPSEGKPGDPRRNYTFYSTPMDLATAGYIEEEYFIAGNATRYRIPDEPGKPEALGSMPYRTRIVVRRPKDNRRFTGVVVVDWQNVTAGHDAEVEWGQAGEFFVGAGWAWVGASVQRIGMHGFDPPNRLAGRALKQWSPARYGSLDLTAGGSVLDDSQSYDIYSQIARIVRQGSTRGVLNGLQVRRVYAGGSSQSASYLVRYYNSIQPITKTFDAFMVSIGGAAPRLDQPAKLFKVYTEVEVARYMVSERVVDTRSVHTWEIAGSPHVGTALFASDPGPQAVLGGLLGREIGPVLPAADRLCERPHPSAVESWVVHRAAYAALDRWVTSGVAPAVAERIHVTEGERPTIVRDKNGIALGGIRLPRVAVPTALNSGENQPGNASPENAFCPLYGAHIPFDAETVKSLYPTRAAYTREVKEVTDRLVRQGFVLDEDAAMLIADAERDWPLGNQ